MLRRTIGGLADGRCSRLYIASECQKKWLQYSGYVEEQTVWSRSQQAPSTRGMSAKLGRSIGHKA